MITEELKKEIQRIIDHMESEKAIHEHFAGDYKPKDADSKPYHYGCLDRIIWDMEVLKDILSRL